MKISNKPTGHAIIEVDQSGQNHILLYGGTNKEIDFEYIDEVLSHFSKGDIVVLQNEINNVPYIIERCYEKEKYPHTHILFTMGKEGSRVLTDKEDIKVEALKVNAVDTTGAGDTYIGYFVRGIVEEMPLLETAQMATKASAIAVTRFGAVDSIPNYEEVFE